jgi:hypothetical protein
MIGTWILGKIADLAIRFIPIYARRVSLKRDAFAKAPVPSAKETGAKPRFDHVHQIANRRCQTFDATIAGGQIRTLPATSCACAGLLLQFGKQ